MTNEWFLSGERVRFRHWQETDIDLAVSLWGNPDVTRLIADLGNPSPEQARDRLVLEVTRQRTSGMAYWPVFTTAGEHLGCCGLRPYRPKEGIIEVGVHLLPQHWGKGYATESLACSGQFAFETLEANGLFARHHPLNVASGRALTRLGFRATHLEFMPQTGLEHPCFLATREEFIAPPRRQIT